MYNVRKVTEDIVWVGASDRRLALFENIFPIPRGVSYNSYVLLDEKTVLLDTVDASVAGQFFENLEHVLDGRKLDYLIVNHMEPDHCAMIGDLVRRYPEVQVVGNTKTFGMIKQFFGTDFAERAVTVKEGDTLATGAHTLHFVMAPMVHWPEVMVTYDEKDKVLFAADGFGTFGALNGNIFADEVDFDRDWLDDARRYYTNIVGKYGASVQALLKKASGLEIAVICPLHGPIWRENLGYILEKYQKWSTYEAEDQAVVILYATMYGNTASAADALAGRLAAKGVKKIAVYDVSNTHVSELISEIFPRKPCGVCGADLQRRHLSGDGEPARRHEGTCGSEQDRSTDGERHLGTDDGKADERKTGGTEKCDDSGYADHHKIGDGAGAGRTA